MHPIPVGASSIFSAVNVDLMVALSSLASERRPSISLFTFTRVIALHGYVFFVIRFLSFVSDSSQGWVVPLLLITIVTRVLRGLQNVYTRYVYETMELCVFHLLSLNTKISGVKRRSIKGSVRHRHNATPFCWRTMARTRVTLPRWQLQDLNSGRCRKVHWPEFVVQLGLRDVL